MLGVEVLRRRVVGGRGEVVDVVDTERTGMMLTACFRSCGLLV